jgi:hypothetical protein
VSILAAVQAEMPRWRIEAEALMLDAGQATRPTGGFEYDPDSDSDVEAADDLFDSACKIQSRNVQPTSAEVGGRTSVTVRTELHLPVDTDPLTAGDVWTVTAVHALSTVENGTAYRVLAPVGKTLGTARRYEVEQVVS